MTCGIHEMTIFYRELEYNFSSLIKITKPLCNKKPILEKNTCLKPQKMNEKNYPFFSMVLLPNPHIGGPNPRCEPPK